MSKFIYVAIMAGFLAGCAHVSEYGRGCRDGIKDLEPQLGTFGVRIDAGDVLDNYCDTIELNHKKTKEPRTDK